MSRHAFAIFSATIVAATIVSLPARADASAWDGDARSGVRLVAGGGAEDELRAAVEIRLAPGWKTYWRYPGDSGVPPQFDFGKSENVKSVKIEWPAPQRITDSEGTTIGYKGNVLFPLRIVPQNASKPVRLRLNLDYAICEKLCVPAQGQAELVIKAGGAAEPAISLADKTVPKPRPVGADAALAVKAVTRDNGAKPSRILVDVAAPAGAKLDLFAEGPAPDWALPVPERIEGAPTGLQRFVFALDGLPPGAHAAGAELKITAVAGADAIETTYRLD